MSKNGSHPALHKHLLLKHDAYKVYAVNALAVRDESRSCEEFGNFALHDDFPQLIPKDEIWVTRKGIDREGVFYIANALTRMKELDEGAPEERAYTAGLNVERALRDRLNGTRFRAGRPHRRVPARLYLRYYLTIPDEQGPVEVWQVDANLVRSWYKTDYTEGGHGYVYRWVPKGEIWIDNEVLRSEVPFIVTHEYLEQRLMRDAKLEYDAAHEICSRVEYQTREGRGVKPLLAAGRRKLTKADLPKLARPEVFAYVLKHYVKK